MFFLGGRGGKRSSRVSVGEKFSQDERSTNRPVCNEYYMLSSGGHHERGFLDPRTPWADACNVSAFDNPSTCSHSDDSGGADAFVPPRTPRSSGYDFLYTCGLCCYMSYVYYMLYVCYMSSSEPSSGNSDSVWIYRRVIFGKQNWLCTRTPCTMCRRSIFGKQN